MKMTANKCILLAAVAATRIAAAEPRLPSSLPLYYAPAFLDGGQALNLLSEGETNGVRQSVYVAADQDLALSVEIIQGDRPKCEAVFSQILAYLNHLITSNQGAFVEITPIEACAEVTSTNAAQTIFVFILPSSVQIWTFSRAPEGRGHLPADFKTIRRWANRQRYEEARQAGNVAMGHWQKGCHDYAKDLLESGRRDEALVVLEDLLATAPFDYKGHLLLVENFPLSAAATNSARIVFKNAEDSGQILRSARFLGSEPRSIDAFPPVTIQERGLQVILIPLPPCNPWLLEESAAVLERITEIPVKVRRLNEAWSWGAPDRVSRQREIQDIIVRFAQENIEFDGWSKDRYLKALTEAVQSEDALSKYWVGDLAEKARKEPGQYLADSRLGRLCALLESCRTKDSRTMYVAITEANIYSGDSNYVFSLGAAGPECPASILSYSMMLGETLGETYDSRQRLVERIAKELVPASLKQLGLPRSTDPTCPYSYSSGVDRLDQKTLILSDEVKEALRGLRGPPMGVSEP